MRKVLLITFIIIFSLTFFKGAVFADSNKPLDYFIEGGDKCASYKNTNDDPKGGAKSGESMRGTDGYPKTDENGNVMLWGYSWPGWDKFCEACPGEYCCSCLKSGGKCACNCPCEVKRCEGTKCVSFLRNCDCFTGSGTGDSRIRVDHEHGCAWTKQYTTHHALCLSDWIRQCLSGRCPNILAEVGFFYWQLSGCPHCHSAGGFGFDEECLSFMRDEPGNVAAHGYQHCYTDLDCGAKPTTTTTTTKPYHYECDINTDPIREFDSKAKIDNYYYQCVQVNTPGQDTCQRDLFERYQKDKKFRDRIKNASLDLYKYSFQCEIKNAKYTCDKYYQCTSDFNGSYASVQECRTSCTKLPSVTTTTTTKSSVTTTTTTKHSITTTITTPPGDGGPGDILGDCLINYFTLDRRDNTFVDPLINITGAPATLSFQTNADIYCESCEITCFPENCGLSSSSLVFDFNEILSQDISFRYPKVISPQVYTYELVCQGKNGFSDSQTLRVKVLPHLNWREINPGSF